jgi:hypothetical protein
VPDRALTLAFSAENHRVHLLIYFPCMFPALRGVNCRS